MEFDTIQSGRHKATCYRHLQAPSDLNIKLCFFPGHHKFTTLEIIAMYVKLNIQPSENTTE